MPSTPRLVCSVCCLPSVAPKYSYVHVCPSLSFNTTFFCGLFPGLVRMKDTKGKKGAPTVVKSIVKDKTRKIEEKYVAFLFVSACASISCNLVWMPKSCLKMLLTFLFIGTSTVAHLLWYCEVSHIVSGHWSGHLQRYQEEERCCERSKGKETKSIKEGCQSSQGPQCSKATTYCFLPVPVSMS